MFSAMSFKWGLKFIKKHTLLEKFALILAFMILLMCLPVFDNSTSNRVIYSVIVLNVYHRSPSTSVMPRWIRLIFVETLPRLLRMQRPISTRHMLLQEAERMEKERTIGNVIF